ncbi:MAG: hypothetical protein Q8O14_11730 [bacterium]|nr:hypothetical protein [bacterium]
MDRYTYGSAAYIFEHEESSRLSRHNKLIKILKDQTAVINNAMEMSSGKRLYDGLVRAQLSELSIGVVDNINGLAESLSNSIGESCDRVERALFDLGDRLIAELSLIVWENKTQTTILKEMRDLQRDSLRNKAAQLVRQALVLITANEFNEAEKRIEKALEYDITYYNAYYAIGMIRIHQSNAEGAISSFEKSLRIGGSIGIDEKHESLWAISRVNYSIGNFELALKFAKAAIEYRELNFSRRMQYVDYLLKNNLVNEAINAIRVEIERNPSKVGFMITRSEFSSIENSIRDCYMKFVQRIENELDEFKALCVSIVEIPTKISAVKAIQASLEEISSYVDEAKRTNDIDIIVSMSKVIIKISVNAKDFNIMNDCVISLEAEKERIACDIRDREAEEKKCEDKMSSIEGLIGKNSNRRGKNGGWTILGIILYWPFMILLVVMFVDGCRTYLSDPDIDRGAGNMWVRTFQMIGLTIAWMITSAVIIKLVEVSGKSRIRTIQAQIDRLRGKNHDKRHETYIIDKQEKSVIAQIDELGRGVRGVSTIAKGVLTKKSSRKITEKD